MLKIMVALITLTFTLTAQAENDLRKIGTWNMKWLGTNSGNQLDSIENVNSYKEIIINSEATLLALQEIGATHSVQGQPKCYYLDLITEALTNAQGKEWTYILDTKNRNQRLAYLYRTDHWSLTNQKSVWPGASYRSARQPFIVSVEARSKGFTFDFVNVHFKAFPDAKSSFKRSKNIEQLSDWLSKQKMDNEIIIAGDTNIYPTDIDIEQPLFDAGFIGVSDSEKTAVHDDKLSNRFDRFYYSLGMRDEIKDTLSLISEEELVDVLKDDSIAYLEWFDTNISDHFPVVMSLAVE